MTSFFKGLAGGLVLGAGLCYVLVSRLSPAGAPSGLGTGGVDASGFACLLGGCGEEPLAIVQGTPVRWKDLPPSIRGALHDRAMAAWLDARETLGAFAVSVAIAKERGDTRPLDELPSLAEWVAQEPVDDGAVNAYFEKNKASFAAGVKFEQVKEQIRQIVRNGRTEDLKREKAAELGASDQAASSDSSRFEIRVAPPRHAAVAPPPDEFQPLPPPPGAAALPDGASHWLVEFTPYACESCGYSKLQVDEFLKTSKVPVRFVRIAGGPSDVLTTLFAKAGHCASRLGPDTAAAFDVRAFAPAPVGYDALVRSEGSENAARAHVLKVAREAGVKDEAAFGDCLASAEAGAHLAKSAAYAKVAGAGGGSPTLVLDGQRVPGGAAGLARYASWILTSGSGSRASR